MCEKERPPEIIAVPVSQEEFDKAQAYSRDKSEFSFFKGMVSQAETTAWLWFGVYALFWNYAISLANYLFGVGEDYEITISLAFMAIQYCYQTITTLPFDLYSTFVIEQRHGFNKQTLALYFMDMLKSLVLGVVIGVPVLAAFISIIRWGGEYFYIYVWAFVFAVQLTMLTVYPVLIQPLFNKVDPLPEGELRTAIEKLAQQINFPLTKLYQIDGSKRSGHSNAYFYGFCNNKRIVLYDTLIEHSTTDEVVAVLGHELGHWKLNHTAQMLVVIEIRLFVLFFLYGLVIHNQAMYTAFGISGQPVIMGFMFFSMLQTPMDYVLDLMNTLFTRMNEFGADAFAVKLGKAAPLKTGLIALQKQNLGNMNPDKWYSTFHYSHPPLIERLQAIDECAKKEKKAS